MDTEHYYEVNLGWQQDRKGTLSSPVLDESIEVATPPEFPKGMEGIWSPEHFFVAAVSSCLMTTFLAIAEYSKLDFNKLSINAEGKLEKADGKFVMSKILLKPELRIPEHTDPKKAERVLQKSEVACLISNSITSTVTMETEIVVERAALST
ncbi:MAG: OsmC family peroxiredoxin [Balneolaceae bacterium]|nr:OsmC family peroxiredoxin [Balneolaceae bacterium]